MGGSRGAGGIPARRQGCCLPRCALAHPSGGRGNPGDAQARCPQDARGLAALPWPAPSRARRGLWVPPGLPCPRSRSPAMSTRGNQP